MSKSQIVLGAVTLPYLADDKSEYQMNLPILNGEQLLALIGDDANLTEGYNRILEAIKDGKVLESTAAPIQDLLDFLAEEIAVAAGLAPTPEEIAAAKQENCFDWLELLKATDATAEPAAEPTTEEAAEVTEQQVVATEPAPTEQPSTPAIVNSTTPARVTKAVASTNLIEVLVSAQAERASIQAKELGAIAAFAKATAMELEQFQLEGAEQPALPTGK